MFKKEIVFVNLSKEETKQFLSKDNVIREYRLTNINLVII